MKISSEVKRKELPQHFKSFLSFIPTNNIKSGIFAFTFILLDLICILPLLYPKVDIIYFITIPFLAFINLWMIRLLFKNPYSIQFESVLFVGVLGIIGTICYFILVLKMAYLNLGIRSASFYIISSAVYLLAVLILAAFQIKKYSSIEENVEKKKKNKSMRKYGVLVVTVPAVGYVVGQYIMNQSQILIDSTMLFVFSFISLFWAYIGAKFIYKYYFMRKNIHFVSYQQPPKKWRKEFREKGIKIK